VTETVLLVEDDPGFRDVYRQLLADEGYSTAQAATTPDALLQFRKIAPRLVLLDLMLPPSGRPDEGAALADKMLAERPSTKVIVVSGAQETELALRLVQRGVYDFLAKPVDPDVLLAVVARAAARLSLEDRVAELERTLASRDGDASGLLGSSPSFLQAKALCERAAPTDVPVLITGESGTGKEVFARYLHAKSRRSSRPLLAVNCGALAPTLLESTLFGHKKGSFTGAVKDAPGLFVEADKGTLFLDEIGDMDPGLQVKLLRVLETGELLPVGASKPVTVDVRVVSATHRPLEVMVANQSFRDDLYWRVRGIEISLPTLADRTGDLPLFAQHFLNLARALVPKAPASTISPGVMRRLEACDWPGNLRQLRHEMQRALVMAGGRGEILEEDLSPSLRQGPATKTADLQSEATEENGRTLEEKIAALEHREIVAALRRTGGNKSQAAVQLGLSRQGLLNKMDRHGLK
jgi:DNA-binding NtrC family response regulator